MSSCTDGLNLRPQSVHDAAIVLNTLTERFLESKDPRAAFTDVYGIVSSAVAAEIEKEDGMFLEPAWISRLAGRFCERYLETLRWNQGGCAQDCGAWHVAYAYASSSLALPVQSALLGFSAHINYDLVFGIEATILEFGHRDAPRMLARFKHDHDQVNTLLRLSVAEALEHLATRHRCRVSSFFRDNAPLAATRIAMALLTQWRERVWSDVMSLLANPAPSARSRIARDIDRRSSRIAQLLALPGVHLVREPSFRILVSAT